MRAPIVAVALVALLASCGSDGNSHSAGSVSTTTVPSADDGVAVRFVRCEITEDSRPTAAAAFTVGLLAPSYIQTVSVVWEVNSEPVARADEVLVGIVGGDDEIGPGETQVVEFEADRVLDFGEGDQVECVPGPLEYGDGEPVDPLIVLSD